MLNKFHYISVYVCLSVCLQLFDHIAQCVSDFLDYMGMKNANLPAGFALSFPCEQTAIDKVTLDIRVRVLTLSSL